MATLNDWIGSWIEQALQQFRDHEEPRRGQTSLIEYKAGESNLYIRQENRQRVQVLKWKDVAGNVEAIVCDRATRLDAQINKATASKRGRVADLLGISKGSILELHKIELRVAHCFDPYRITLWITDFDLIDQGPLPSSSSVLKIDHLPNLQGLLKSCLTTVSTPEDLSSPSNCSSPGSFKSQMSTHRPSFSTSDAEDSDPHSISQLRFATQVPRKRKQKSSLQSPNNERGINAVSEVSRPTVCPQKRRRVDDNHKKSSEERIGPHTKTTIVTGTSPRLRGTDDATAEVITVVSEKSIPTSTTEVQQPEGIEQGTKMGRPSLLLSHPKSAEQREPVEKGIPLSEAPEYFTSFKQQPLVLGRFLPRRLFKIPRDQGQILDKGASWQPPKVGEHIPYGCVPPTLLEAFAAFVDQKSQQGPRGEARHSIEPQTKPEPSCVSTVHGVTHNQESSRETSPVQLFGQSLSDESEDDCTVAQEDWPSSPAERGDRLPPDSSAESCVIQRSAIAKDANPLSADRSTKTHEISEDQVDIGPPLEEETAVISNMVEDEMRSGHLLSELGSVASASTNMAQTHHKPVGNDVHIQLGRVRTVESTGSAIQQSTCPSQQSSIKVQVKRTPIVYSRLNNESQSSPDSANLPFGNVRSTKVPENVEHIPATFKSPLARRSPRTATHHEATTPNHKTSPALEANWNDAQASVGFRKSQYQTRPSQCSEPAQNHTSFIPEKIESSTEKRSRNLPWKNGRAIDEGDASDFKRQPSLRATKCLKSPSMGEDDEAVLPSDHLSQASKQLFKQANSDRREFLKRQRWYREARGNDTETPSPVQRSSRSSFRHPSSELQVDDQQTPATSVLPGRYTENALSNSIYSLQAKFMAFKQAYPEYKGQVIHFERTCHLLQKLQTEGKAPHAFLLDDFICRHRMDYVGYQAEQAFAGFDPVRYIDFYNDRILEPKYTQGIVKFDFINTLKSRNGRRSETPLLSRTGSMASKAREVPGKRPSSVSIPTLNHGHQSNVQLEDRRGISSSPTPIQHPPADGKTEESQSSKVESWLNQASGHESPILGELSSESRFHQLAVPPHEDLTREVSDTDNEEPSLPKHTKPSGPLLLVDETQSQAHSLEQARDLVAEPVLWWHDRNTAFKEWARRHEAVAHRRRHIAQDVRVDYRGALQPVLKRKINISAWRK